MCHICQGGERRALGRVPREQQMLKGHLPTVLYHRVYSVYEDEYENTCSERNSKMLRERDFFIDNLLDRVKG